MDGRPNHRNKVAFTSFSGEVWTENISWVLKIRLLRGCVDGAAYG